jgi:hypothetical protein
MIKTGKINHFTGEEILRAEESDIKFFDTDWNDLTIEQKATFCSFIQVGFLGKSNEEEVMCLYEYYQLKNRILA